MKGITDEQNKWVYENCTKFRNNVPGMIDEFERLFGRRLTHNGMNTILKKNGCHTRSYTKEQEEWLKKRWYVERKVLVKMFNEKFNETRTLTSIECKMVRLGALRMDWVSEGKKNGNG